MKILVVENDEQLCIMYCDALGKFGTIEKALTPDEAREKLMSHYDAVICDIMLYDHDSEGLKFMRLYKGRYPDVVIIAVSGDEDKLNEAKKITKYTILKPAPIGILVEMLEDALGARALMFDEIRIHMWEYKKDKEKRERLEKDIRNFIIASPDIVLRIIKWVVGIGLSLILALITCAVSIITVLIRCS